MDSDSHTRIPVQQRSKLTREKILEAGRELFADKGYLGTNAKEIARKAGVAIGSFYAYFSDKGDVFLEIVEEYYQRLFQTVKREMDAAAAGLDLRGPRSERKGVAEGAVRELIGALYRAHDINPALHREISLIILLAGSAEGKEESYSGLAREVGKRVEAMDAETESWLAGMIARIAPGIQADIAAPLVFRVCEETVHRLKQFPGTMPPPGKTLDELSNMVCAYLFGP